MTRLDLPYGRTTLPADIPDERLTGVFVSQMHDYTPAASQEELVRAALEAPVGTPRLRDLAVGKESVVLIASDHTRPVPSRVITPLMLEEIRAGNPDAKITILIATGCHRGTTAEELRGKFGDEIVDNEHIHVHDCDDESLLVEVGELPSGGRIVVNTIAAEADLLVAEGFIEPHFFAGYSGGRKSVFPGVCSRKTVMYNHNSAFIDDPHSRTGVIEGNPIHRDMLSAARQVGLSFILNVVINADKEAVFAVAGDVEDAHKAGREFLDSLCKVKAVPSDIAITTNGGYPLDQNIYQSVKSMTAAEATLKPGGAMIILSRSDDGHGGEQFHRSFAEQKDLDAMMAQFLATPADETIPDQWQCQIFARLLRNHPVILVSDAPHQMVRDLHMTPAHSVQEALELAERAVGSSDASVCVIPDGVSVIVEQG